jgi:nucleotide-binding universal stress UspA family protein
MDTTERKKILVTWDFTAISENALEYAVRLAKTVDNDIVLLHIIKKEKDQAEAIEKLTKDAEKAHEKYGMKPEIVVLEGSIFTTIGEYTAEEENNVHMVCMGTHGIRGMQKLTGSWALKVIASSKVPFIVVQDEPPKKDKFSDIVFPINFKQENKEKLVWAIYLTKYFDSTIHIFKETITDKYYLKKVNLNLSFALKYFKKKNIKYEIHSSEKVGHFAQQTVDFAEKINADLTLIMTSKDLGMSDYIMGPSEQYIIANSSSVPVMCVNPRSDLRLVEYGAGGFGA